MKIPLKNKKLEIALTASVKPDLDKLKKELADFFSKNEIEGYKIKDFRIEENINSYRIIPIEPPLEESLSGDGEYELQIEEIGKKYGLKNFGFIYWCYHK